MRVVTALTFAIPLVAMALVLPRAAYASPIELTARPAMGDTVYWGPLGTPNLSLSSPQSFTSTGGTTGNVHLDRDRLPR